MKNINSSHGFSLIELLITVAIIGILAGVAYPSYVNFVIRSDRSEGQRELLRLANLQEQLFVDSRAYTSDMTNLGLNADPFITNSTNYSIDAVINVSGNTFTLTATAKNNQTKDTGCTALTVDYLGRKAPEACWEK